ncbi:MAG: hypothetical protein QOK35_275, partial [Pseudonocardiales bacterium]|nr:hypothetical protein [Pseudonocardiales bacterium]
MTLALLHSPAVYPVAPAPARRTLLDVLAETMAQHPEEAAVDAGGTVLSYRRLAERVAVEGREVWNTYGPTEATVVTCAAQLTGQGPVRIGLPLDGWALAVVDGAGEPVA